MKRKLCFILGGAFLFLMFWSCEPSSKRDDFPERAKIALRDLGNKLLLAHKDSTSRVMPVLRLSPTKYELSFQSHLAFDPGVLAAEVRSSFKNSNLPKQYRVEVMQCSDGEVAYSYEVKRLIEKSIIACRGRVVPENCYKIQVDFLQQESLASTNPLLFYGLVLMVLIFLIFIFASRYYAYRRSDLTGNATSIGSFRFYPEENKLVKEAEEISLSKKECELLAILIAHPNQIVKREVLTKKVWEDNGVIVGRSLDTYISKLRKKLKDDDSIKITNVHGVGYKLELT